jgi:hypothetical protein
MQEDHQIGLFSVISMLIFTRITKSRKCASLSLEIFSGAFLSAKHPPRKCEFCKTWPQIRPRPTLYPKKRIAFVILEGMRLSPGKKFVG